MLAPQAQLDRTDQPSGFSMFVKARPPAERMSALKEQVYASFTGLAIVTVFALDVGHTTARHAFFTLLAGIVGITIAGLVADIIAHFISHAGLPKYVHLRTMMRIAGGAIGSASIPLIVLCAAWMGLFSLQTALQISVGIYLLGLALIALVAAFRTGLPWRQQLIALGSLVGLGATAVAVLVVAH